VKSLAQEALPLGFRRRGLCHSHGSYPGSIGTQYAVTSCHVDGEGADSENNQRTAP
jgi:hypothetical protein